MDNKEKLVKIAKFMDDVEAQTMRAQLESEGIEAIVMGDKLMASGPYGGIVPVEVYVKASDIERAQQILDTTESLEDDESDDEDA